jgi:hypothetical protein
MDGATYEELRIEFGLSRNQIYSIIRRAADDEHEQQWANEEAALLKDWEAWLDSADPIAAAASKAVRDFSAQAGSIPSDERATIERLADTALWPTAVWLDREARSVANRDDNGDLVYGGSGNSVTRLLQNGLWVPRWADMSLLRREVLGCLVRRRMWRPRPVARWVLNDREQPD